MPKIELFGSLMHRVAGDYDYGHHLELINMIASREEYNGREVTTFDEEKEENVTKIVYPPTLDEAKDAKTALIYAFANCLGDNADQIKHNKKHVMRKLKAARAYDNAMDRNTMMSAIKQMAKMINDETGDEMGRVQAKKMYDEELRSLWNSNIEENPFWGQLSWPTWLHTVMSDSFNGGEAYEYMMMDENKQKLAAFTHWGEYRQIQLLQKMMTDNPAFDAMRVDPALNFTDPLDRSFAAHLCVLADGLNTGNEATRKAKLEADQKELENRTRKWKLERRERIKALDEKRKAAKTAKPNVQPDEDGCEMNPQTNIETGTSRVATDTALPLEVSVEGAKRKRQAVDNSDSDEDAPSNSRAAITARFNRQKVA